MVMHHVAVDDNAGRTPGFGPSRVIDGLVIAVVAEQRRVAQGGKLPQIFTAAAGSTPRASAAAYGATTRSSSCPRFNASAGTPKALY